jgi:hypothetical protein
VEELYDDENNYDLQVKELKARQVSAIVVCICGGINFFNMLIFIM